MCGQAGVIFGSKNRKPDEIGYLTWAFTSVLEQSEQRGPHATGIAWVKQSGEHRIFKRPIPASEFIQAKEFGEILRSIDSNVTALIGHTRFKTRGDVVLNANNHPLRTGKCLLTHNGTILNADYLFHQFGFERNAEVDSEIIGRIADSCRADGRIDMKALRYGLALCRGQMSAVIVTKTDPSTVVLIKGNKPLETIYQKELQAIIYASDAKYLRTLVAESNGWKRLSIRTMRIYAFNCADLPRFKSEPLNFVTQVRCKTQEGANIV